MLCAIPTVLIVEDLVSSRSSLELHDEDRFHARALSGRRTRVNALNRHAFRKEVELTHV
jgi:hypothetical protein